MRMNYTSTVREFTLACNDNLPEYPIQISPTQISFIKQMIDDEMRELSEAGTVPEQADALIDAIYYLCDCAVKHGINLDPLFSIVHAANMEKVINGKVIRREDGKIMKPEDWQDPKPLLEGEISRQLADGAFNNY